MATRYGRKNYGTGGNRGKKYQPKRVYGQRTGKRFRKGYDRVGGLYKLYGKTKNNGELKYLDKALTLKEDQQPNTDTAVQMLWTTATGAMITDDVMDNGLWYIGQSLVNNQQGQGAQQRIGRKITVKSIFARLGFVATCELPINAGGTIKGIPTNLQMRIVMLLDKQYNGTPVKATDIFEDTAGIAGSNILGFGYQPAIVQLPNMANSQRFRVIKDKLFNFSTDGTTPWEIDNNAEPPTDYVYAKLTIQKMTEFYKKVNIEIENAANDATLNGIKSSNIILAVTWNGMGAAGTQLPTEATRLWKIKPFGLSRTRYTDL